MFKTAKKIVRPRYYFNKSICAKCGGRCCKRLPGAYTPFDIKRIFGSADNAVKSGEVAIDWWEGSPRLYFMRPKTKGKESYLYDPSWGGECIHLSDNGCLLSIPNRPHYCKTIIPSSDFICGDGRKTPQKYLAAVLWKKSGVDLSSYPYSRPPFLDIIPLF